MGTLRWLDILVIAIYLATLTGVGLRFSRRQKTTQRYFIAQRSIPGWAMGLSLLATLISSVTFIAYPGSAYAGDWSNLVPGLTVVPVVLVTVFVVIPFFRHAVGVSAYEYFGKRFGYGARVYSSLAYAAGHLSKMGFVFYLLALTVNSLAGWKIDYLILIVGAMTIGYTMLGGIEAVIWADVIQGLVLWLGVLICLCFLLLLPPGGPAAMLHAAWNSHKISLGSTAADFSKPTILVLSLYGFSYYLQRYTCDQTVVQRYLVARTDRQAVRGVLIGSLLCVPVWALFMLIGTLCWTFFKLTGETLPAQFARGDQAFPYFVTHHLPAGFAGLFIAALFGATMANLSSDLNSLAAVAVEDYYRLWFRGSSERAQLIAAKVAVLICGAICMAVASVLGHSNGSALSLWFTISAIVSGGLVGLFALAFLTPRANATGAYIGIAASLLFTTWAVSSLGAGNFPLHNYMVGAIGQVLCFGIGYLASLPFQSSPNTAPELTIWSWIRNNRVACEPSLKG
ncbi:MAG: sodium:solute symporter [Bryobacteraceae bacterium]